MRLLISLLLLLQAPTGAVSDSALRDSLTSKYTKKYFAVKNFPSGTRLRFDANGALLEGGTPGSFTLDGGIRIEQINVSPDRVEVRGRQTFLEFNTKSRRLEESATGPRMTLEFARKADVPVEKAMDTALIPFEGLSKVVPAYWTKYLTGIGGLEAVVDPVTGVAVARASQDQGLVPKAIKQPTPQYPQALRVLGIKGTVVLRVIVDEKGKLHVADIAEPFGFGLDQSAIEAVHNQWEFEPALKDGKPVKVYMRVRVDFNPPR
jgi:TonB family protein